MTSEFRRRDFLKASAAFMSVSGAGGFLCSEVSKAAPIDAPVVDQLEVRVLIDSYQDIFLGPQKANGVEIQREAGRSADYRKILHNQFGLSLLLESRRASEERSVMLDFGYSPDALLNNIDVLEVDPRKVVALIVSHGHYDHFGGLIGFLDKYRDALPTDVALYAGGEDNFCRRHRPIGPQASLSEWGTLDRRELTARRVRTILCETPTVVGGHAFTTGRIARSGFEKVSGGARVEYAVRDGLGCDASHFTPAELQGKIVADEHYHEHATCFHVKDRGLVVITSCGHVGIMNTIRQAQEVSGVRKVHALIGGFHLGPAPAPYVAQSVAALKALDLDVVVPMHCSGLNFMQAVREQMPEKLLVSTTGSRVIFGA